MSFVALIAPTHRPEDRARILESYARQTSTEPRRLVVIPNGSARGQTWPAHVVTLESDATTAAAARNRGIDWASAAGAWAWITLDGDDHYAPGYLDPLVEALRNRRADVAGYLRSYVETAGEIWRTSGARDLTGGAMGARTAPGLRFDGAVQVAEERPFRAEAERRGLKIEFLRNIGEYIYHRSHAGDGHAYAVPVSIVFAATPGQWVPCGTDPDRLRPDPARAMTIDPSHLTGAP